MEKFKDLDNLAEEITVKAKEDWRATVGHQRPKNPVSFEEVVGIRNRNTEFLKRVVENLGWPSEKVVGKSASHWAWYIAQHSDHDLSFQEKCLSSMKAIPENGVSLYNLAYLTDRVRVAKGLPQLYATQFQWKKRKKVNAPVEDPKGLSKRRKEMGLDESFQSYHQRITGMKL